MVNIYPLVKKCPPPPLFFLWIIQPISCLEILWSKEGSFLNRPGSFEEKPFSLESPYWYEPSAGQNVYLRKYRLETLSKAWRNVWIHPRHIWVFWNPFSCRSHTVFKSSESNEHEPFTAFFFDLNKVWMILHPSLTHWMERMLQESF